jgi:hypothetical protein
VFFFDDGDGFVDQLNETGFGVLLYEDTRGLVVFGQGNQLGAELYAVVTIPDIFAQHVKHVFSEDVQ